MINIKKEIEEINQAIDDLNFAVNDPDIGGVWGVSATQAAQYALEKNYDGVEDILIWLSITLGACASDVDEILGRLEKFKVD